MVLPVLRNLDEVAGLIANPPADKPIAQAVGNFGRLVCDRISAVPTILDPLIQALPGAPGLGPARIVCKPYWDAQGFDGPTLEPPFAGGQCPGTIYSIQLGQAGAGGEACGFLVTVSNLLGPIESVSFDVVNVGGFPNPLRGNLTVVHAGGTTTGQVQGNETNPPCRGPIVATSGPDDCGDPPPVPTPGENPAPDPGPLPPGTGLGIGPRGEPYLILPPILDLDDGTEIPTGDGPYGPSGPGGGGPDAPIPGDEFEGDGSGAGGDDEEFPEPPEGERWIGGCVRITARPQGSGVIPQAEPDDIYPTVVGNARLLFKAGESPREVDTPVQIRQKTTCLWEPVEGFDVIGMRINVLPNYSYSITPYSVPIEQE